MQSRRPQDYTTMSTSSKMRNQHGRNEIVNDPYVISYREAPDRSRRSFSPHKLDGSRRFQDTHRVSDSTDRRNYAFHLGGGRSERVRSKSPQYGLLHKKDHFEDEVVRRKHGYHEDVEFDHGAESRYVHGYAQGTSRASKEKDYSENRIVEIGSRRMLNQKSIPMEVDAIRGLHRLPLAGGPTKNFGEPGGSLPLSSRSIDVGRVEHERHQYSEPIASDKLAAAESYKEEQKPVYHSRDKLPLMEAYREEEKPVYHSRDKLPVMEPYREEEKPVYHSRDKLPVMEPCREEEKPVYHSRDKLPAMETYREKPIYHSRDILYTAVPASHSKDILSSSQYKDFVSTSSGASVSEFPVSYRDGLTLPASDGYSKNSVQLTEPIGSSTYAQRSLVDTMRAAEAAPRNLIYNQREAYSPSRHDHEDYVYSKTRVMPSDDQGCPSDNMHRMMSPHIPHDYDHALIDYDRRDLPRPSNMLPLVDRFDNTELSYGDLRKNSVLDHPTLQKQTFSDYLDMSRKSYAIKQDGEFSNFGSTHAELERGVPRDYGVSHLDVSQDHQISYYGYRRDAGQVVHKERFQSSSDTLYDSEMQNVSARTNRIEEELRMREPSEKLLKRKNNMDDDINRHDNRIIMSSKWHIPEEFEDLYDSDQCLEEDISGVHSSKTRRVNHNEYRKVGRTYDGREQYGNFASDDWFSSQDTLVHPQRSAIRFYKNSGRYIRGNTRPSFLNGHNPYHGDRRSGLHKQHKVWKRIEDYNKDVYENDGDTSEECSNLVESEPSEDTDEFKELVHKAFLTYSKKVNVNPSVRRRYTEQGKAGSLFCIACGRSLSKEFMNTQSLVRHAFMSHKVGLRAQHLGLQKAICVLMGWNTFVPHDMITWVPEVLPDAEAMAQKEDLILWPPIVIIRNISMSNSNPKEQKVIPIEGVEAFLRGKGFVGGKINVCLGRPADQSVMVVKFLGTFTGLESAERLHKYFAERKHGRAEFARLTSNSSRSSSSNWLEAGIQGDKLKEQLLYGYMGISEDLDSADFNTKKYCFIKSKKEILDLANAPVRTDER
ncbi:Suppressor of gene silencing protein [Melia azedarach]|uniref:Suppressor of gene silencing protein n=1 Tax=Melia azedarach TaxID=155640 RepID=A0ACC1YCD2_MELAZ|nr:Suppressor of gene silencing protein [Melia azedarach]